MYLQLKFMSDNSRQWTLHYRSHSLTGQLRLWCSDTFRATQQTASKNKAAIVAHTARAIHLQRPVINKESGRKLYSSHAWSYERQKLSMSKFTVHVGMLRENHNNKKNQCVSTTQQEDLDICPPKIK